MRFTDIFIKRPVLATVVSLLILLIGAQAGFKLPIRQYPELYNTTITVITTYPGANADLIQGFITVPIQQAVADLPAGERSRIDLKGMRAVALSRSRQATEEPLVSLQWFCRMDELAKPAIEVVERDEVRIAPALGGVDVETGFALRDLDELPVVHDRFSPHSHHDPEHERYQTTIGDAVAPGCNASTGAQARGKHG